MKTFKFGQLLEKEDICDRQQEIKLLEKICRQQGRGVVYGARRFGKSSVVKNVIVKDFLAKNKKSLAIYSDCFQLVSLEEFNTRLKFSLEKALSERAKVRTFLNHIKNYVKNFQIDMSFDSLSGAPSISLRGNYQDQKKSLSQLFQTVHEISKDYETLLIFDEFQDIVKIEGLEALLRSEIQSLTKTPVILLGSKRHILEDIFQNESRPFYGFGIDIELKAIPRGEWLLYMNARFKPFHMSIVQEGVEEICALMRDVPNSIQELCQWIALKDLSGKITKEMIHQEVISLLDNKANRYIEKLAGLSEKERKVLIAAAHCEPVSSPGSSEFVQMAKISATAIRASLERFTDQGILNLSLEGYWLTDPIFSLFLKRRFKEW